MKRTLAKLVPLTLAGLAAALTAGAAQAASADGSTAGRPATGTPATHPVIVIGLPGLLWSDISARRTPEIWRLATRGSVASLAVTTIHTATCPDDAWLTLNSGARAAQEPKATLPCPAIAVRSGTGTGRATVPAMAREIGYNSQFSYRPYWGVLAKTAPGCSTAVGPGAALALADPAGRVVRYVPALSSVSTASGMRSLLARCPLTVTDLGALPAPATRTPNFRIATGPMRASALKRADQAVGRIVAAAPPGADIVLAGLGDNGPVPHLHAIIVAGPCCRSGLLTSRSTRQHGIVTVTDLTPSILHWLGAASAPSPPPSAAPLSGAPMTSVARGPLPAAVATMTGRDAADQVYRSIVGWFFLIYGVSEAVLFAIIAFALRGGTERRTRARTAWYTAAAAFCAGLPAGTFLAGLVPWGQFSHPAVWLYGLGLAWAAVIAVPAVTGPWRRQAFGPPGFVCAVTLAIIGADVMTGSRLELGAPFGLSLVEAGRFYGIGNNALGVYVAAAMITTCWAAAAALERWPDVRRRAVLAAAAVAAVAVVVLGWPAFGAKVGGTIAIVPAFCLLLAIVGGVRITLRRGLLFAVSGIAVITLFAVLDYLFPVIGPSHLGGFIGSAGHGGTGALGTLHRKISSNLHSLTEAWFTPVIPAVAVVTGAMLAWPARLKLRTFAAACERSPLLRACLGVTWLALMLSWLAEDSGVSVVAAALPVILPISIALTARIVSPSAAASRNGLLSQQPDDSVATGRTG